MHEVGIVHAVGLAACGNSGDPQSSEITLLLLSADVSVIAALHHGLLCGLEELALAAVIALGHLQYFISSFARHECAFDTCHSVLPP